MNASPTESPKLENPAGYVVSAPGSRAWWISFAGLAKPRLSALTVVTALVGYLAAKPVPDWILFLHLFAGTALAAGGAAALNQWIERDTDRRMERTRLRAIPTGQVTPTAALAAGFLMSAAGVIQLTWGVNPLAGTLALATLVTYLLFYTPMKRSSRWSTEIGAVAGALPPLIGWAAADGSITTMGWILFGILFFWQMPHFQAIAWLYRKDYARVGFPMLAVLDPDGRRVANNALLYTGGLIGVTLLPGILGYTTHAFTAAALVTGLYFLIQAEKFRQARDRNQPARRLFLVSIIYLPLLLGALVADRWLFS